MLFTLTQFFQSLNYPQQRKHKVHDYSHLNRGDNYVFDPIAASGLGYMTGFGTSINIGDYIILDHNYQSYYQVEAIDYYTEPSDMWMALLKKVSSHPSKIKESDFPIAQLCR